MSNNNLDYNKTWVRPSIRIGIVTVGLAMAFSFLPNIYLYIKYGVFPPLDIAFKSWLSIATIFNVKKMCIRDRYTGWSLS